MTNSCDVIFELLDRLGAGLFVGVPDSALAELCEHWSQRSQSGRYVIASSEGGAVALAAGHYFASGRFPVVFMQNSGFGNCVNPLTSLVDRDVYGVPMLLVIGWRGEPGTIDEPQHHRMGLITIPLLRALGIHFEILARDRAQVIATVGSLVDRLAHSNSPVALLVPRGRFQEPAAHPIHAETASLTRRSVIGAVMDAIEPNAVLVASTGYCSRELIALRLATHTDSRRDFLNVGAMGHSSQVALGIAIGSGNPVWCVDGDGALTMHLGGLAAIGAYADSRVRHIVVRNGRHESVGNQPIANPQLDFVSTAKACGYIDAFSANSAISLRLAIEKLKASQGPSLLQANVELGVTGALPRPTGALKDAKSVLMEFLRSV